MIAQGQQWEQVKTRPAPMRGALPGWARLQGSGGLGRGAGPASEWAVQAARRPVHWAEDARKKATVRGRAACVLGGAPGRAGSTGGGHAVKIEAPRRGVLAGDIHHRGSTSWLQTIWSSILTGVTGLP